ncbi:replication initiation negative regulator SeqA [Pasteurellaceae bacterium HPA106]|uniref:replication initiation negative regulator SeqA n=1 Tax=Spirabiliibacterium pneumoniae TaxID=221400 RepID=UPI001AADCC2D|nr:replication initiation negative regulator SeqA [Spirabiliibacterium pneumoniae]MBE2895359.1 replication initiation negative regulator SeqA [Spirabiliibacterium pneumoniae]
MKIIEVDEEIYQYLVSNTQSIGESASDILRRLLNLSADHSPAVAAPEPANVERAPTPVVSIPMPAKPAVSNVQPEVTVSKKTQSQESIMHVVNRVRKVIDSEAFQQESKGVVKFLMILTALYRANPETFAQATESLAGRTRVYFARDEATLLQAGTHTKPKQIPETPYWVITNTNSQRKMLMLEGAMTSMHLPTDLIDDVRSYFTA